MNIITHILYAKICQNVQKNDKKLQKNQEKATKRLEKGNIK